MDELFVCLYREIMKHSVGSLQKLAIDNNKVKAIRNCCYYIKNRVRYVYLRHPQTTLFSIGKKDMHYECI